MRTKEQIFSALCAGGAPTDDDLLKFCKLATGEELEIVLVRANLMNVRNLHWIENELEARRHKGIAERLEALGTHLGELKKPHWTLIPTFWLVIVGCIAGIIAAVVEVMNREEPIQQPTAVDHGSTGQQNTASPNPAPRQTPAPAQGTAKP